MSFTDLPVEQPDPNQTVNYTDLGQTWDPREGWRDAQQRYLRQFYAPQDGEVSDDE